MRVVCGWVGVGGGGGGGGNKIKNKYTHKLQIFLRTLSLVIRHIFFLFQNNPKIEPS